MRLYLVQHGEAKPEDVDPDRHLTEKGVRDVEKTAAFLGSLGLRVDAVWQSGKTRAAETAEILRRALGLEGGALERGGLAPNDPVEPLRDELARAEKDVVIVGHLPFLDRLASRLVAGSESAGVVGFRQGGVVCIERDPEGRDIQRSGRRGEEGAWRVLWTVIPEILP